MAGSEVRSGFYAMGVDLRGIVDVAIEAYRPSIDSNAHSLNLDIPRAPLVVIGDRTVRRVAIDNVVEPASSNWRPGLA